MVCGFTYRNLLILCVKLVTNLIIIFLTLGTQRFFSEKHYFAFLIKLKLYSTKKNIFTKIYLIVCASEKVLVTVLEHIDLGIVEVGVTVEFAVLAA